MKQRVTARAVRFGFGGVRSSSSALLGGVLVGGVSLGIALLGGGCAAVLDVEEATCDPDFDKACSGGGEETTDDETNGDQTNGQDTSAPDPGVPDAAATADLLADACEEYCQTVIDACEAVPQFKTASGCQSVCEAMYLFGDDDNTGENTVQCHLQAAENALNFSDGMEDNCVSAGPMGLSCGGGCNNYCDQMEHYCPEEFEKMDNCIDLCRDVPRADVPYTDGFPAGNTLECRVYHVQLAVLQQPNRLIHCGHAAGNSLCADE